MLKQQFVHWLLGNKKRNRVLFELNDVPRERTSGFRLDPNNYRDDSLLEEWEITNCSDVEFVHYLINLIHKL
jgi:hypothetical protein